VGHVARVGVTGMVYKTVAQKPEGYFGFYGVIILKYMLAAR